MKIPWYVRYVAKWLSLSHSSEVLSAASISVICVPSYSAKSPTELARATKINLANALWFWKQAPEDRKPRIVFGSCGHAFPGAAEHESSLKRAICEKAGVPYIDAGDITNSVNEMDAWKKHLVERGAPIDHKMLICTCDLHSKAEYVLAGIIFPNAQVYVYADDYWYEVESDHPTDDQASWPRWTMCSIKRYLAFRFARMLPRNDQKSFLDMLRKMTHKPGRVKDLSTPTAA